MSTTSVSSLELQKWSSLKAHTSPSSSVEIPTCELGHAEHLQAPGFIHHLKPADGGPEAWKILVAAVILESLLWGFPLSFGVFQNYYASLPQFTNDPNIAVVGTIATGIAYLGAPAVILVMDGFPKYHRQLIWVGWPICLGGLVAGSFATTLTGLILTQGVMYGIGFVLFYYPTIYFVNEFWIERRGMAFGTMCASSALAGIAFPFTLEALLNKYGYPTTLRALAIGLTVMTAPVIPLLRGRLPLSQHESSTASSDWQCLKKPLFWVYSISNVIQGFGYFFPALFLPSYATATGLSASQGALLVALLSVAQALGQFGFGYASDRKLPLDLLILASTLVSAFAVFVFWYPARSLSMLVIFSLIYGFFGGAWISLWSQMGTTIYGGQPASTLVSISLLCFGAGIGSVAAGPMSARLTAISGSVGVEKYHAVIMFTGACMLASPITVAVWRVTKRRWTTN